MWLCKCECGKEKIIRGSHLRNGHTKSCGCLYREAIIKRNRNKRLNLGISSMRQLIMAYKRGAKKRGLEYELAEDQFAELTQKDCYYCGAKPNNIIKHKESFGEYIYNGLDRIDNIKGYTINNVVSCCHLCNSAKGKLTTQEFKELIKRIYNKIIIGGKILNE